MNDDEDVPRRDVLLRFPGAGKMFVQYKAFRPLRGKWTPCPGCGATWDEWCDPFRCDADDPWNSWHNPVVGS